MKYLNFCSSGSKLESVTCKFTKSRTPSQVFLYKNTFTMDVLIKWKSKTKIHITVIRCKATITPEINLKEEQLQN